MSQDSVGPGRVETFLDGSMGTKRRPKSINFHVYADILSLYIKAMRGSYAAASTHLPSFHRSNEEKPSFSPSPPSAASAAATPTAAMPRRSGGDPFLLFLLLWALRRLLLDLTPAPLPLSAVLVRAISRLVVCG